jgi:hypothetical protein
VMLLEPGTVNLKPDGFPTGTISKTRGSDMPRGGRRLARRLTIQKMSCYVRSYMSSKPSKCITSVDHRHAGSERIGRQCVSLVDRRRQGNTTWSEDLAYGDRNSPSQNP